MARVLVTGAAGFIGSSLTRELLSAGHDVRGIDNLSTGNLNNIRDLLPALEFEIGDHCDRALVRELCDGVDVVFHQGALPSVAKSVLDPLSSHIANVEGTLNVLLSARDAGVRRIVYAASSSAYGNSAVLPKRECMPTAPISPYGVQKLTGELYMRSFASIYAIETVCLRYFNVFGPRQAADSPYSGVLAKFITSMLAGTPPTIFGDGTQSRDFTYIKNVVAANVLAAWAPSGKVYGNLYNIATGERHSLIDVYSTLAAILSFDEPPVFKPPRAGDIQHSLADITRAELHLGYHPNTTFMEGLRRTVDWYRDNLGARPQSHDDVRLAVPRG